MSEKLEKTSGRSYPRGSFSMSAEARKDIEVRRDEKETENVFVDPNLWGSDVGDLVEILNRIDIPEEFRESLQKEINSIAEGQSAAMERDWGPDA